MDAIEVKKNVSSTFKKISSKNHPSFFERITKKYYSLNDAIEDYNVFLKKIEKLKAVETWGTPLYEVENYNDANANLEKITSDLKKAFKVVPYEFTSININPKEDSVFIGYKGRNSGYNEFKIPNFSKKVTSGFKSDSFNELSKPLDFSKVLECIINDINSYWIRNILNYIETVNRIDENNKQINSLNKKIEIENEKRKKELKDKFDKLDLLSTIFPIKLNNGELFIPCKLNTANDYKLISSSGKPLIKILNNDKFDKSITSILFDKCKVDRKSIPSWVDNNKLFNSIDSIDEDFEIIKAEFMRFEKKYGKIEPYKIIYVDINETTEKKEEVKVETKKEEKEEIKEVKKVNVDVEELRNKVYKALIKANGKVGKRIDIPDQVLFSLNDEGIKEIDKRFQPYLNCLNLAHNNFENISVKGVDFSNSNPKLLNPQTIYDKDLSGTKFNSFPFFSTVSFDDVNLCDAIIIITEDIDIDLSNAFGNVNTYVNVNNKEIPIRIKNKRI